MKRRRVKITGLGFVTPAGIGRDEFWQGILEPISRVTPSTKYPSEAGAFVSAEVKDFRLEDFLPNVPGNVNLPNVPGNINVPNVDIVDDVVDDIVPDLDIVDDIVPDLNVPNIPNVKVPDVKVPNIPRGGGGGGGRGRR